MRRDRGPIQRRRTPRPPADSLGRLEPHRRRAQLALGAAITVAGIVGGPGHQEYVSPPAIRPGGIRVAHQPHLLELIRVLSPAPTHAALIGSNPRIVGRAAFAQEAATFDAQVRVTLREGLG